MSAEPAAAVLKPALAPAPSRLPWLTYAVVLGATGIAVGIIWDISWHSTIGRDTFWTPAHMAIYLGGVLAGGASGWLAIKATFGGTAAERGGAVRIAGARAPLGAWVSIWGAIAMLTSAPLDDWWHNAYGLDVQILSPPHAVLAAGMMAVVVGPLLLVLSLKNRQPEESALAGDLLFLYAAGILLTLNTVVFLEYSFPNSQHASLFYLIACASYPFHLVAAARASRLPWSATLVSVSYMGLVACMVWILPLFPARPLLGPIYNPVDHMVPPPFPLLLCVPALAIDLLFRFLGRRQGILRDLLLVALSAAAFLALFLCVQWRFSEFLLTPAAENQLFAGGRSFPYSEPVGEWMREFWNQKNDALTGKSVGIAFLLAFVSSAVGLFFGKWMARVRR